MKNDVPAILSAIGEPASTYYLLEAFSHPEPIAKIDALEALSNLDVPKSVQAAIEILKIYSDNR
jgi:hypothetical protein